MGRRPPTRSLTGPVAGAPSSEPSARVETGMLTAWRLSFVESRVRHSQMPAARGRRRGQPEAEP
ncbi:hypothetical protein [Streptomyces sp. NPDC054863]